MSHERLGRADQLDFYYPRNHIICVPLENKIFGDKWTEEFRNLLDEEDIVTASVDSAYWYFSPDSDPEGDYLFEDYRRLPCGDNEDPVRLKGSVAGIDYIITRDGIVPALVLEHPKVLLEVYGGYKDKLDLKKRARFVFVNLNEAGPELSLVRRPPELKIDI